MLYFFLLYLPVDAELANQKSDTIFSHMRKCFVQTDDTTMTCE